MTDDTYTHDPSAFDGDDYQPAAGEGDPGALADRAAAADQEQVPGEVTSGTAARDRSFGWRGRVLVGWMVVAFALVPGYLFFFPRAPDVLSLFGLGFRDTYLVFPLVPAILLGLLAVWATTRP